MKNKVFGIILLLIVGLCLTGCSSDDDYYGSDQNKKDCYNAGKCKTYVPSGK